MILRHTQYVAWQVYIDLWRARVMDLRVRFDLYEFEGFGGKTQEEPCVWLNGAHTCVTGCPRNDMPRCSAGVWVLLAANWRAGNDFAALRRWKPRRLGADFIRSPYLPNTSGDIPQSCQK